MTALIPPELVVAMRQARHVVALTGAGISAESGIPTFRQAQTGLWARYNPAELATPAAFQRHPERVWQWYQYRRRLVANCQPNAAHRALVRLAELTPRLEVITQNVDGLHQQAGSQHVIELHGNLNRCKCVARAHPVIPYPETDTPPPCPRCGSLLRPDVVWFGEPLPRAAMRQALDSLALCDLLLVVGTSSLVEPAASLPRLARREGALVVEVNVAETPLSDGADFVLRGAAGEILPAFVAALS